jgi:hypothetical protein
MAITFEKINEGRGGSYNGFSDNSDAIVWRVIGDAKTVTKTQILAAGWASGDLPRPFVNAHPEDSSMMCKGLDVRPKEDASGGTIWIVVARYDSKPIDKEQKDREEQPDPLLREAVYSLQFERDERAVDKDINGERITNSAFDPFPEPAVKPRTRPRIHGRMNVDPAAIPSWFLDLKDKVNDDNYEKFGREFDPRTLLFVPLNVSEPMEENGIEYRVIEWDLEYREEYWDEERIDNGFNQLIDNPNYLAGGLDDIDEKKKVPIEIDGERPTEPQLLREGAVLPYADVEAGDFDNLIWETIEGADFSVLP